MRVPNLQRQDNCFRPKVLQCFFEVQTRRAWINDYEFVNQPSPLVTCRNVRTYERIDSVANREQLPPYLARRLLSSTMQSPTKAASIQKS